MTLQECSIGRSSQLTAVEHQRSSEFINLLILIFHSCIAQPVKKPCLALKKPVQRLHTDSKPLFCVFKLHHMETQIKKRASKCTNPLTCPRSFALLHFSSQAPHPPNPFLCASVNTSNQMNCAQSKVNFFQSAWWPWQPSSERSKAHLVLTLPQHG